MCGVREKTHLALAMKKLARHIEPKGRLNVTYTRDVVRNMFSFLRLSPYTFCEKNLILIQKIYDFL